MRTVTCWNDLAPYGLVPLTGEACGLMYRLLCDVTEQGRQILSKCLGVPSLHLAEPWNRGTTENPHVGSILLAPEMRPPLSVFALLESGCTECWLYHNGNVRGIEASDSPKQVEEIRRLNRETIVRVLRYAGTAGDRNLHQMSGRVV